MDQEELFLTMQKPLSSISDEEKRQLRDSGYMDPDGESTDRARELVDSYVRDRADLVYQALTSSIDDVEAYYRLRDAAGSNGTRPSWP